MIGERTVEVIAPLQDRLGPLTRAEAALEEYWGSLLRGRRRRHYSVGDVAGLMERIGDVALNRLAVPRAEIGEEIVSSGKALNITTKEGMEAAIEILEEQKRTFEGQVNHGGLALDLEKARKRASICEEMIDLLRITSMSTR